MATYKSSGNLNIQSPAVEFIEHLTRKKKHVSLFFAAVDLRFEVEPKDSETKSMTVNILGNLISGSYKTVTATFTFEEGMAKKKPPIAVGEDMIPSCLTYIFEFERIDNNIADAKIVESLLAYILLSDVSYIRKVKYNSIDAGYPVEECFEDLANAFKDDHEVETGGMDFQKRSFTISVPSMRENFETTTVTITVIPKNEGSRVKWTIKVKKIDADTQEPYWFFTVACSIREFIQSKFPNYML